MHKNFDLLLDIIKGKNGKSISSRLAVGVVWSLAGAIVAKAFGLLGSVLVARVVGSAIFGEIGIIFSTIGLFSIAASFCLGSTANRYIACYRDVDGEKTRGIIFMSLATALIMGGGIAVCVVLFSNSLAAGSMNAPRLALPIRIAAVDLFALSLTGAIVGILTGFERFRDVARVTVAGNLILPPLVVLGAYYGGVTGYFIGSACGMLVSAGVHVFFLTRLLEERGYTFMACVRAPKEWKILIHYTLPAVASGMMISPVHWFCRTILVNQPEGFRSMGHFTAGNQILLLVSVLANPVKTSVFPIMSNLLGKHDIHRYKRVFFMGLLLVLGISIFMGGVISLFAPFVMGLFGRDFKAGYSLLYILALVSVSDAVSGMFNQVTASLGKQWYSAGLSFVWACVIIGSSVFLIPRYYEYGLAASMFLANLARIALCSFLMRYFLRRLQTY